MSAGEINIAPVEGERFADAAAGEQHERHQRRQMRSATGYEAIGLIKRDPSDPAPRLRRSLKGGLVAELAFRRMCHDRSHRREERRAQRNAIASSRRGGPGQSVAPDRNSVQAP
jgi:hypothetical protein